MKPEVQKREPIIVRLFVQSFILITFTISYKYII
jgi:hypothetical protein